MKEYLSQFLHGVNYQHHCFGTQAAKGT